MQTDDGVYIVPNAVLATNTFHNLSRPHGDTVGIVSVKFAPDDPPDEVLTMLEQTAHQLPSLPIRRRAQVSLTAPGAYRVLLPVAGPAEIGTTVALFQRWLWYAARRSGLRLDGATPEEYAAPERLEQALGSVAGALHLSPEDVTELAPSVRLDRYAAGDTLVRAGERPTSLAFVTVGRIALAISDGSGVEIGTLRAGRGRRTGRLRRADG